MNPRYNIGNLLSRSDAHVSRSEFLGGSTGDAAFAIATKFPNLKIIVQDLPWTVETSHERRGINVTFMAHNFFEEQPVKDADVYMYRWCKSPGP